jgi:hypothetical protein
MQSNLKMHVTVLGTMLITFLVLAPVQAQSYKNGTDAARAGDYDAAVMHWKPLADKGDAMAQFNLALMYHRGLGVKINEAKAVELYKKSAANGYPQAQEYLAAAYSEGWFGLPRDPKKAAYWLSKLNANSK